MTTENSFSTFPSSYAPLYNSDNLHAHRLLFSWNLIQYFIIKLRPTALWCVCFLLLCSQAPLKLKSRIETWGRKCEYSCCVQWLWKHLRLSCPLVYPEECYCQITGVQSPAVLTPHVARISRQESATHLRHLYSSGSTTHTDSQMWAHLCWAGFESSSSSHFLAQFISLSICRTWKVL